jgi:hypothetical protein
MRTGLECDEHRQPSGGIEVTSAVTAGADRKSAARPAASTRQQRDRDPMPVHRRAAFSQGSRMSRER